MLDFLPTKLQEVLIIAASGPCDIDYAALNSLTAPSSLLGQGILPFQ